MAWRSCLNRRNRRCRSRWSHWSRRRRWNVEGHSGPMERIQFIQSALPRLLGFRRRRGHVLDLIILIGWKVLI
jgi:hypothetical protein